MVARSQASAYSRGPFAFGPSPGRRQAQDERERIAARPKFDNRSARCRNPAGKREVRDDATDTDAADGGGVRGVQGAVQELGAVGRRRPVRDAELHYAGGAARGGGAG